MKNISERKLSFISLNLLLGIILIFTSCTRKLVETNIESKNVLGKILIAGDSSEFKDKIRELIIGEFKLYYSIDVVNIEKLNKIDSTIYSGIIIMDTCMVWSGFNPSLKSFMEKSNNREKTILFITAGDPDWKYSYMDVDAITSASDIDNEDVVYNRIKSEIKTILFKK